MAVYAGALGGAKAIHRRCSKPPSAVERSSAAPLPSVRNSPARWHHESVLEAHPKPPMLQARTYPCASRERCTRKGEHRAVTND